LRGSELRGGKGSRPRRPDEKQNSQHFLNSSFSLETLHTSGHASVVDIRRVIEGLDPQKLIPIHTMHPDAFHDFSDKTELKDDGITFEA